jgi:hypothetical protein
MIGSSKGNQFNTFLYDWADIAVLRKEGFRFLARAARCSLSLRKLYIVESEGMTMNSEQVDVYTGVHKGQRQRLFSLAIRAGQMDYTDPSALEAFLPELRNLKEEFRLHASLEEKYVHPLLSKRVPGGARKLSKDHFEMHQHFDDLVLHYENIMGTVGTFEKQRELGLEFYRAWNRFISFYLSHINVEEEEIMPTLWTLCRNEELADVFASIIASQTPAEFSENLEMILPAMNADERSGILLYGKTHMPQQAFQEACELAKRVLDPRDWGVLKHRVGI